MKTEDIASEYQDLFPFNTERELVGAILLGDEEAADVLVRNYSRMIYAIATQDFGLHESDANDVFQHVFERLWDQDFRRLRMWNGKGSLAAFLQTMVRNLIVDRLRGERNDTLDPDPAPGIEIQTDPDDSHYLVINRQALVDCIRDAISKLKHRDRNLIHRKHWQEESYREIAAAEDLTVTNVGVALLRAEKRLVAWVQRICPELLD
jgi:RNA polymerase sigma factor (sigma-70 family)